MQLQASGAATTAAAADVQLESIRPLIQNSIIPPERWTQTTPAPATVHAASHIRDDTPTGIVIDAIISGIPPWKVGPSLLGIFVVRWTLSMSIPLIMTYAIRRRPADRPLATRVAAIDTTVMTVARHGVTLTADNPGCVGGTLVFQGIATFYLNRWILKRRTRAGTQEEHELKI